MRKVIVVTTDSVPGYSVERALGTVFASVAMAKWVGADLVAGVKDFFGGRVDQYEKLMDEAVREAIGKLSREAEAMGADAVVGLKMFSPEIGGTRRIGEVVVYGTAVKLTPL